MSHNQLKKIENLDNLLNLNTLDISNNEIEVLENISHLPLAELWVCQFDTGIIQQGN
jgi:Leucine-rich repeat (LRR) protein